MESKGAIPDVLLKSQVVNCFTIKPEHRRFLPPTGSHTEAIQRISAKLQGTHIWNTHNEVSIAIRYTSLDGKRNALQLCVSDWLLTIIHS